MTVPEASPPPRSRLASERKAEISDAVLDELREAGYEALTLDAIAARARTSKATLYRQWGGKTPLVVWAVRRYRGYWLEAIDTGTLRGDLHALAERITTEAGKDTALLSAVAHAVLDNKELAIALREAIVGPEVAGLEAMIERAVRRGEIARHAPAAKFLPHMVFGLLNTRRLIDGVVPDQAYFTEYIDAVVLPALLTS